MFKSLSFWEYLEYAAETVVVIGALGEFLAEFGYVPRKLRDGEIRHKMAKAFALLLIIGLGVELAALVRTNQLSSNIIAELYRDAADSKNKAEQADLKAASATATAKQFESQIASANAQAKNAEAQVAKANAASQDAVANVARARNQIAQAQLAAAEANRESERLSKVAEDERLARVKIEERLAGWKLDVSAQQRLIEKLKPFRGTSFDLFVNPAEAAFMETFDGIMASAKWTRQIPGKGKDATPFVILIDEKAAVLLVDGFTVEIARESWDKFRLPVTALVEMLIAEGIPAKAHLVEKGSDPNAIHIIIGRRD